MTRKKIPPPIKGHAEIQNLEDLREDVDNPRAIDEEAFAGLQFSMESFGDLSGIVFNTRTNSLVCGHQRRAGLLQKFGKLPILKDGEQSYIALPEGERFYIRLVDWDLDLQRAANFAANNPHIAGHFTKAIGAQLDEIREKNEGLFSGLRLATLAAVKTKLVAFRQVDENIKTEHECPKCHYKWSGKSGAQGGK